MWDYKRLEISAVVYECVSRNELQDKNRETLEIMLDISESVRDQDFRTNTYQPLQQTGSDRTKKKIFRACLVLLCFLLLTAVIVLSVYIYTNNTNYTQERNQLLNKIIASKTENDQLENQNQILKNEKKELLSKNHDLIKQGERLQREKNDLQKCVHELDGWFNYQSSFYFISSEDKSWSESRRYCRDGGADLIIINNKEEQDLVKKISGGANLWIVLTESDEEGRWKWVDGTNADLLHRFWSHPEPSGGKEENCAVSRSSGWGGGDYPCFYPLQWIYEKKSTLKCH
ncbi:CD209 antigen-like protein C [Danio aesculapii]|uniref:CD209 antigen-like protein C n=1 Tax=Danio aesculapii TaxID=1142201 RepID=UPI0024BF931E|nr:CD209 antigen-like protein C [Danio aesculapii]